MQLTIHDKSYQLHINLILIEKIESVHGSLYQIAEELLEHRLPLTKIVSILKVIYQHALCNVDEDDLLKQPCAEILLSFLTEVLGAVDRMGAITLGEVSPAQSAE